MFRDGMDYNGLKWVREETGAKKADVPISITARNLQSDPILSRRNGGRRFNLPPVAKFQTGYSQSGGGAIPVVQAMPVRIDGGRSVSDMDTSSESEDEVYNRSLDSSPQDDKFTNGAGPRSAAFDFSLPEERIWYKQGNGVEAVRDGSGKYPVGRSQFTDVESTDSFSSTEVSFIQSRSSNSGAVKRGLYSSDDYSSSVTSHANVETASKQDFHGRRVQNKKLSDNDSEPPFSSNSNGFATINKPEATRCTHSENTKRNITGNRTPGPAVRIAAGLEVNASASSLSARFPTYHASAQGPWCAVLSYDACVRLCLHSWAKGCMEAPFFLNNECELLRNAFGLQKVLLQSEEELLAKQSSDLVMEEAAPKPKKTFGRMKVQVHKVKMGLDPPPGCGISSIKPSPKQMESIRLRFSNFKSTVNAGWEAVQKVHVVPHVPLNGSFSRRSMAYVQAGAEYIKQVSGIVKIGVATLHNSSSSYETVTDTYTCSIRLKSSSEEDTVRMQAGSGETHVFFPDCLADDMIIEVLDSKGQYYGRVLVQVATIADNPADKLRWWSIYHEPEHEPVGRIQLCINYSGGPDENSHLKCGPVAETVAYDLVLEAAMKIQNFQQRNLLLHGQWKWLVDEFASYYGVSEAYTKLRYLSYVMDVITPTEDCLTLVNDLLLPVFMKRSNKNALSHQENRMLGEIDDQIQRILALVFENYKSLDESLPSGIRDVFGPATGSAALVLKPAVKLFNLLHDILTPEAQLKFCRYFQAAARKRSRLQLQETDELISSNNGGVPMDPLILASSYQKMRSLISSVRNEILTDIEIHNQNVLPSFIDLPNLSSSILNAELCSRLRAFLVACPPAGPSPPVVELVIATADFQKDLSSWKINPVKSGVDAKELFHLYIMLWIQDKRRALLESCKLDKVKWSGVKTQHLTNPFVDNMYDQLKETLTEYEIIIRRWPEYTFALEHAIADVEKAVIEALDKQYVDVLSPLKDNLAPKIFGYVQKFAKGTVNNYIVPDELGILLNSMKRMLDVLRPRIETQLQSWTSCLPAGGGSALPGECLSEITVMLRAKFRSYVQGVVERLAENSRVQNATKLKKIIHDGKENLVESDLQTRMQPLKELLIKTIEHLHTTFEPHVFITICRGFWDRMGQDILHSLENSRENRSLYKSSRIAITMLDDTFASQIQRLLGNKLQGKDLEPPRSMMEVRSMLCKDAINDNYYY